MSRLVLLLLLLIVNLDFYSKVIEQVFRRGNYDEPETLDPQQALAVTDVNILNDIYEGLMTYDNHGQLIFGQAQSYTVSKDKKTYIFKLKKNLKWSNNTKLTAHDFVKSIQRAVDPNISSTNFLLVEPIKNAKNVLTQKMSIDKFGVSALDDNTVIFNLDHPTPFFLDLLSHPTFSPVYLENNGKINNYINNGPFKLQEWKVNSHIIVIKNPNYIDATHVKLDKVIFYPINQQSIELKRYQAGDLDYTNKVLFSQLNWVRKNLSKELHSRPMLASYYYSFNVTKPPFKDNVNLRKALSFAIDKNIIAKNILGGERAGTDRFVPHGISNYISDIKTDFELDKNKLNKALYYYKLAGYDKDHPLKVNLLFHTNEANKVIATAVASMWKKNLGVQTTLINQEWRVFLRTRLDLNATQIIRDGWIAQYDDPLSFLDLFVSNNVQNASGYSNVIYDRLIKRAENTANIKLRSDLLYQAEQILLEDLPVIPVYTPEVYHLVKPYVSGFGVDNRDRTYDRYISINR